MALWTGASRTFLDDETQEVLATQESSAEQVRSLFKAESIQTGARQTASLVAQGARPFVLRVEYHYTSAGRQKSASYDLACSFSIEPVEESLSISPDAVDLTMGATRQLVVQDAEGKSVPTTQISWSSTDSQIASVSDLGVVTAVGVGSATVTASRGAGSGTAQINVSAPREVGSVTVSPGTVHLITGGTQQVGATVLDTEGVPIAGSSVDWSSTDPGIATVSTAGLIRGVSAGSTTVIAGRDGKTATVAVSVSGPVDGGSITVGPGAVTLAVGASRGLTATVRDGANNILPNEPIAWSASPVSVATVSANGRVTGVSAGTATITATSGSRSGTATVTVTGESGGGTDEIKFEPASLSLRPGERVEVLARVPNGAGGYRHSAQLEWTRSNSDVASISGSTERAQVFGRQVGTVTMTATGHGYTGSFPVTVAGRNTNPIHSLSIVSAEEGGSIIYLPENRKQFRAVARDENFLILEDRQIAWSSETPELATVNSSGLVTAHAPGDAWIRIEAEGKVGRSLVRISAEKVPARIRIFIERGVQYERAEVGERVPVRVWVANSANQGLAGLTVHWNTEDASIGRFKHATSVTGSGGYADNEIEATGPGETPMLIHTGDLELDRYLFWVRQPAPIDRVRIVPASFNVQRQKTVRPSVEIFDTDGFPVQRPVDVTFSMSNPSIASVDASGEVTGRALGTTTLTATAEGVSGTAQVTVIEPVEDVHTVTVTPNPMSLEVGRTQQTTVTLRGWSGAVLQNRIVVLSSSNPAVASINTSGVVTAQGVGTATITATSEGRTGTATVNVTNPPQGGSTCSVVIRFPPLQPGQASVWHRSSFPGSLDVRVSLGTMNAGSSSNPSYQYRAEFRNHYGQTIQFSFRFQLGGTAPNSGNMNATISPGGTSSDILFNAPGIDPIWVYVGSVRLGGSSTNYCK